MTLALFVGCGKGGDRPLPDRREISHFAAAWTPLGSLVYYKYVTVVNTGDFFSPGPKYGAFLATRLVSTGPEQIHGTGRDQVVNGVGFPGLADPREVRIAWSKARNQVAIRTDEDSLPYSEWHLYTPAGQLVARSLAREHLSWSPDGSSIVFDKIASPHLISASEEGLWVASLDSLSSATKISNTGSGDRSPAWAPVAQRPQIAFDCGTNLCLISTDGTGRTQVVNNATEADWAPDGSWLVFTEKEGDLRHIAVVNTDGTNPHRIKTALTKAEQPGGSDFWAAYDRPPIVFRWPQWSPDGTKIVVGGGSLWVLNPDGSGFLFGLPHTVEFGAFFPSFFP